MARGYVGRKAKSVARMAYKVNKALGVPTVKAKKRANKAGRKVAAKLSTRRKRRSYRRKRY